MTTAIQTGQSCGANCWYAHEPECRCSCAGVNHGLLLTDGVEQPRRNCTILGTRYVLGAIVGYAESMGIGWRFLNTLDPETFGKRRVRLDGSVRFSEPTRNEKGAAVWVRSPTDSQEKWPEVAGWMADHAVERFGRTIVRTPSLLWVRDDAAETFDAWEDARLP